MNVSHGLLVILSRLAAGLALCLVVGCDAELNKSAHDDLSSGKAPNNNFGTLSRMNDVTKGLSRQEENSKKAAEKLE